MIFLRHLLHFVSAATLFVAALALAPTGALAHAGHDHGPMKVQSTLPAQHATAYAQAHQELKCNASLVQSGTWLSTSSVPSGGEGAPNCAGGCCHYPGHGCCAAALAGLLTVGVQPSDTQRLFARLLWGPGITPGALLEPPRYLV